MNHYGTSLDFVHYYGISFYYGIIQYTHMRQLYYLIFIFLTQTDFSFIPSLSHHSVSSSYLTFYISFLPFIVRNLISLFYHLSYTIISLSYNFSQLYLIFSIYLIQSYYLFFYHLSSSNILFFLVIYLKQSNPSVSFSFVHNGTSLSCHLSYTFSFLCLIIYLTQPYLFLSNYLS